MSKISTHADATRAVDYKLLKISSPEFEHEGFIPSRYTCDGSNIRPQLDIENIPGECQSLAVIVEDPDAPSGTWTHWITWNIPVTHQLKENDIHGLEGMNDFRQLHYGGPCPPSGIHRYFFKVYALDTILELQQGASKKELEKAMGGHILAYGELMGKYKRQ